MQLEVGKHSMIEEAKANYQICEFNGKQETSSKTYKQNYLKLLIPKEHQSLLCN